MPLLRKERGKRALPPLGSSLIAALYALDGLRSVLSFPLQIRENKGGGKKRI